MPYKSDAQRRFFHSPGAAKAGITNKQVHEFDTASKGMVLPEKQHPMVSSWMGMKKKGPNAAGGF